MVIFPLEMILITGIMDKMPLRCQTCSTVSCCITRQPPLPTLVEVDPEYNDARERIWFWMSRSRARARGRKGPHNGE